TSCCMRSRFVLNVALDGSIRVSSTTIRGLPSAAVGLEAAGGAAPDGVHAVHLVAAALAQHLVVRRRGGLERNIGTEGRTRGCRVRHVESITARKMQECRNAIALTRTRSPALDGSIARDRVSGAVEQRRPD